MAVLLIVLLAAAVVLGHLLHGPRFEWLSEGSISLLVGIAGGGLLTAYHALVRHEPIPAKELAFDTDLFFELLLPPIIFYAGFSVKKKYMWKNFVAIVCFGVFGTWATAAGITWGSSFMLKALGMTGPSLLQHSLSLGAILASSDSVAALQILHQDQYPSLYSLVFGEGVVNDATSIVLLKALGRIRHASQLTGTALASIVLSFSQLFVCSLALGVGMGLLSALLIKHTFVKHSTDREVSLVALLGFLAFMVAEALGLSGIFAVFFAGITMQHYTWHSLSPSAKVVTVYCFRVISFLAELFLFIYAGFNMWGTTLWRKAASKRQVATRAATLACSLTAQVLLARGAALLPLMLLANVWRPPDSRIGLGEGTVIWWGGCARGAITIALAYHQWDSEDQPEHLLTGDSAITPAAAMSAATGAPAANEPAETEQTLILATAGVVVLTTLVLGSFSQQVLRLAVGGGKGQQVERQVEGRGTKAEARHSAATLPSYQPDDKADASVPFLARDFLARHLHWNERSVVYDLWHRLDDHILHPLFGGRQSHGHPRGRVPSHPPSPGQRTMLEHVILPTVLQQQLHQPGLAGRLSPLSGPFGDTATAGRPGDSTMFASDMAGGDASTSTRLAAALPDGEGDSHTRDEAIDDLLSTRHSSRLETHEPEIHWEEMQDDEAASLAAGEPSGDLAPDRRRPGDRGA